MAIDFDALKEKVADLAQTGVAKAKELADVAVDKGKELGEIGKLKVNNATEQETIKKAYSEIGRLYFAERGDAPEAPYADLCQKIRDAQARIDYNNQRIADIKAASGAANQEDEEEIVIEVTVTEDAPADQCEGCAANQEENKDAE